MKSRVLENKCQTQLAVLFWNLLIRPRLGILVTKILIFRQCECWRKNSNSRSQILATFSYSRLLIGILSILTLLWKLKHSHYTTLTFSWSLFTRRRKKQQERMQFFVSPSVSQKMSNEFAKRVWKDRGAKIWKKKKCTWSDLSAWLQHASKDNVGCEGDSQLLHDG